MAQMQSPSWSEAHRFVPEAAVRVFVWELPVRVSHWVMVAAIAVLSFTGYYIYNPFLAVNSPNSFAMARVREIHVLAGFALICAFLLRLYWFFVGNRWSHWRAFIPIHRRQWRGMGRMVKYYTFMSWDLTYHVGHNALAGATYTVVLLAVLVEILTGLTLFSQTLGTSGFRALFGWLPRLIDIQTLRLLHFSLMWLFIVFVIHHVYSAVLISWEERNGLIESIFTGYKFVPAAELEEEEGTVAVHDGMITHIEPSEKE